MLEILTVSEEHLLNRLDVKALLMLVPVYNVIVTADVCEVVCHFVIILPVCSGICKARKVCAFGRNLIRDRVNIGLGAARAKGVRLGRPTTLHKRVGEVMALKKQGLGLRVISQQLGMAVSSVHSLLAGQKVKRQPNR
jgi:hypothetical protein